MLSVGIGEEVVRLDAIPYCSNIDMGLIIVLLEQLLILAFGIILWGGVEYVDMIESRIQDFRNIYQPQVLEPCKRLKEIVNVCIIVAGMLILCSTNIVRNAHRD